MLYFTENQTVIFTLSISSLKFYLTIGTSLHQNTNSYCLKVELYKHICGGFDWINIYHQGFLFQEMRVPEPSCRGILQRKD